MYVVTLDQNDITWLAFAAGIATGSGNAAAQAALYGILSRIEEVEALGATAEGPFTPVEDSYPDDDAPAEDFGGTLDPQFVPTLAPPPSRPQSEFGPGHGQGGVTGTPIA